MIWGRQTAEPSAPPVKSETSKVVASETTLDQVPIGRQAAILRVGGAKPVRRRLMEMGLVRGERVLVQRVAPLGDPIQFRVMGYQLALRRSDARAIVVSLVDG